ncbi:MAG: class I SAM-dependent methyltransferase [Verrucomicrobiae bacterium]|nr:class I SAM-dependent methyltransferase [Verrucomicrobiae bacterium]
MKPSGNASRCPLCDDAGTRVVLRAPDFEYRCRPGEWMLAECGRCGHVFLDPLPSIEEVGALYPPGYYTVNPKSPIWMEGRVVEAKMTRDAEGLRRQLGDRRVRSVVDLGGGNLSRLIRLKKVFEAAGGQGVEATCVDLQFDDGMRRLAEGAGVRCVVGNVETDLSELAEGAHDLIVMRQLIEHLRDPGAALRQVRPKLAPGGLLVIDTPNRGGWDYRLFRRRYWGGYHVPRHFHLFDRATLAGLLRESGYDIERQGCTPSIAFWIISLRNRLGLNSLERGASFWEFLSLKSLPVVGTFYLLDLLWLKLGGATSNQFVWARRGEG